MLYEQITSAELAELEALQRIDPMGEERADLRMGIICSMLDACHRTKGQVKPPKHFMPFVENAHRGRMKESDMKAVFARIEKTWNKPRGER